MAPMICHVCHQDAVGQCKKCGKFYCPEHGDVECVKCREALSRTPTDEPPDLDLRLPQYGRAPVAVGGPGCYKCGHLAVGACAKCGQFYCADHRGGTSFFDNTRGGWWQSGRVVCID